MVWKRACIQQLLGGGDELEGTGKVTRGEKLLDGGLRAPHRVHEPQLGVESRCVGPLADEARQAQRLLDQVAL